jgi:hypothetical protein
VAFPDARCLGWSHHAADAHAARQRRARPEDHRRSGDVLPAPAAALFHSVLDSLLTFTGLLGGHAAYTWGDWALALAWPGFGNLIGGITLVTSIRLLQSPHRIAEERTRS